ncbi:MAG: 5-(carboxyamino)imidazole ribonucleotide synthase [Ignavibacteria bacterium]|nr:5-(carboxyamino)imidazole ribonucleotide synthase [Ignavibacteria bacterium]
MEQLVTSEFKLGIIAGGQLGKLLSLAASNWDIKTYILDNDDHCPASTVCTKFVKGNPTDYDSVYQFGKMVDMLTFEMENINIEALLKLKEEGKIINPDPSILKIVQDKGLQKEFYKRNNIPSSPFQLFDDKNQIIKRVEAGDLKIPFVQKLRKGGYDGRGVAVIRTIEDLNKLLEGPSVVENYVDVQKEISVIVARNRNGEVKSFPVVEMEFNRDKHLVEELICPAFIDNIIAEQATGIAYSLINNFNLCGLLAVEMFVDSTNNIWVNEIAPRPHNSGHHTIESIITSQYEQLLRAIFNFPLGDTHIKKPSVMINLLGEPGFEGKVKYEGLTECMKIDGVKIHLYGKKFTKPYRKMGHITILDSSIDEARKKAEIVKQKIKVKSW